MSFDLLYERLIAGMYAILQVINLFLDLQLSF